MLADRGGGLVDDAVRASRGGCSSERSKRAKRELDADHVGREHAQRLLQQLLSGLVALEDDDRRASIGGILVSLELARSDKCTCDI